MKIWFPVIRGGSGADVFTARLVQALEARGVCATVTTFPGALQFAPWVLKGVPAPAGTTLIHTNSWHGFAFRRAGIPLVVTNHLNVFDPAYAPYKSLAQRAYHKALIWPCEQSSFRAASAITCVSHYTARTMPQPDPRVPVRVIHNFVDTGAFSPGAADTDRPRRRFRLLFVGNLIRRKGADLLAPIMGQLGPDFELWYTAGIRRRHVIRAASNMINIGRVNGTHHLAEMYRQCDALLFPSRLEGFGLVVLEAMACGLPVVAAHNSALPEVVEDGITGLLCPTDDVEAFALACRRLAEQPGLAQQLGAAGRERAVRLFSEPNVVSQYLDLYGRLTGTGART